MLTHIPIRYTHHRPILHRLVTIHNGIGGQTTDRTIGIGRFCYSIGGVKILSKSKQVCSCCCCNMFWSGHFFLDSVEYQWGKTNCWSVSHKTSQCSWDLLRFRGAVSQSAKSLLLLHGASTCRRVQQQRLTVDGSATVFQSWRSRTEVGDLDSILCETFDASCETRKQDSHHHMPQDHRLWVSNGRSTTFLYFRLFRSC